MIGSVVGIAILCCVVGTVVDCFVHIYKYWCSCLNKAYQTEMVALRTPPHSTRSPSTDASTVLVARAIPPSYSTIVTSPTDPAAQPMLPKHKPPSKRELMMRVSKVAIRDCIPDVESDSEEDEEQPLRHGPHARPKDLKFRNDNTLLSLEFEEHSDRVLGSRRGVKSGDMQYKIRDMDTEDLQYQRRTHGVDTHDLQYYQIVYMKDKSIGTSNGDLSSCVSDGTLPKQPRKAVMVSRDMQTDDVITYAVPQSRDACAKSSENSEKKVLYAPTLPPSYSSIFQQNGNLVDLSSVSCNGYVELPPKEKPRDSPG